MNLGRIGFVAKGNFDPNKTDYKKLDQVTFGGSSFFARVNNPTGIPTVDNSNPDWQLSAKKGQEGPAVSVVNNLIDGGDDKALSAEQGKELNILVEQKIDTDKIADNLQTNSDSFVLSARQGKVLNDLIANFSGQIGSGIIGEAFPATTPISEGFGIYTVSTAGIYTNFLDSSGDPIEVLEADLVGGLVQLWGSDNVWEMNVTQVNSNDPESSETGYIQVPQ